MCTISWFVDAQAYHIFFNRDEDVNRPKAAPPALLNQANVQCVMPVDPKGNGTWLVANEFGCAFALLNFYQGRLPKGRLHSRGEVVRDIASSENLQAAEAYLNQLDLNRYAPFSLLAFSPEIVSQARSKKSGFSVPLFCWTGKALEKTYRASPLFSSAVYFDRISASRMQVYNAFIEGNPEVCIDEFYALHKSHLPEKSHSSICMHREDAKTVSFSHVSVSSEAVSFEYVDGAPCETRPLPAIRLRRKL